MFFGLFTYRIDYSLFETVGEKIFLFVLLFPIALLRIIIRTGTVSLWDVIGGIVFFAAIISIQELIKHIDLIRNVKRDSTYCFLLVESHPKYKDLCMKLNGKYAATCMIYDSIDLNASDRHNEDP